MRHIPFFALLLALLTLAGCDVNVTVNGDGEEPAATDTAVDAAGNSDADPNGVAGVADDPTAEGDDGELLNLNLPNVNVKIGGADGVSVDAPGVDVDVNGKDGVSVEAPGTSVKVK